MPELRKRQDIDNWTTPTLSDIFPQEDNVSITDEQRQLIQNKVKAHLVRAGYKIEITDTRSMPNYILLRVYAVQESDIIQARHHLINNIAAASGWVVGTQTHLDDGHKLDIFVRTDNHHPMSLRQVIPRQPYRKAESNLSFVMGVNLQQQVLVRDLDDIHHLMVVGNNEFRQTIVRSMLVTFLLTNTPSDLRIAIISSRTEDYPHLMTVPHVLGQPISNPAQGNRLLNGMVREIWRRQSILQKAGSETFSEYNESAPQSPLPRLLILLDSIHTDSWLAHHAEWQSNLSKILRDGSQVGLHILLTAPGLTSHELLNPLYTVFKTRIMSRSVTEAYLHQVQEFHYSLLRFVDAFLVEDGIMKPLELPTVTENDVQSVASYWQKNAEKRIEMTHLDTMSRNGANENLYEEQPPAPPVPQPPPAQVLAHAVDILSSQPLAKPVQPAQDRTVISVEADESGSDEAYISSEQTTEKVKIARVASISESVSVESETIRRAQALATYLGWLGRGPLIDVLGLSLEEAEVIMAILRARQILERGDTPTPRLRLSTMVD